MSRTLVFRPLVNDWKFACKGKLRDLIQDRGVTELSYKDIKWLEGLKDAEVDGAATLINAINEHVTIELKIEV